MTAATFFTYIFTWINTLVATYALTTAGKVAAAIQPAGVALIVCLVMWWGWNAMTRPVGHDWIMDTATKIVTLGVVMLVAFKLALFANVLFPLFMKAPDELVASVVGTIGTGAVLDKLWLDCQTLAGSFFESATIFSGPGHWIAGILVWVFCGGAILAAACLMVLSTMATGVLLSLAPLFILLSLFPATRQMTAQFFATLAQYAFIAILTIIVTNLLFTGLALFLTQNVLMGEAITLMDITPMIGLSVILLVVLKQVPSISASLASGIALSTFGLMSHSVGRLLGHSVRNTGSFVRGITDTSRGRHDNLPRLIGQSVSGRYLNKVPRQAIPVYKQPPKPGP